jgi:hypothetical protein
MMGFRVSHTEGTDYILIIPAVTGDDLDVEAGSDLLHVHRGALFDQLQEIEDECYRMFSLGWIENGEGDLLDVIGRIVGLSRRGAQSDETYRKLLAAQVMINRAYGRAQTLIDILKRIVDDADEIELQEVFPAAVIIGFQGDLVLSGNDTHRTMKKATAAGVRLHLVRETGEPAFAFGPDADDGREGFGDLDDPTVGGKFAELIGE